MTELTDEAKVLITKAIDGHNAADAALDRLYYLLFNQSGDNRSVVALSQRDPAWSADVLGFSTHGQTIGSYGCAITALAMWLNFVTPQAGYTPRSVNEAMKEKGGYAWDINHTDRNLVNWSALNYIFPQLVFNGKIDCPNSPAPLNVVDAMLDKHLPVMVWVKYPGVPQHFVLLTLKRTTTYDIANPWTGTMQTLTPQYGATPSQAICGVVQLAERV